MASWFLESVIGLPFGKLAVLALYGVLHGIAYGAIFSSLGRTRVLAWLLAAVHMVAFVVLVNGAWGPPKIVGQAAILTPWVAFYALFRRAKADLEKNYFTESPSTGLALFCGLPAIGPIACAVAACVFSPRYPIFRLKHGSPGHEPLPVILPISKIRVVYSISRLVFGLSGLVILLLIQNGGRPRWLTAVLVLIFIAFVGEAVARLIPRGNRLVISAAGICEYRYFYPLWSSWSEIERFDLRQRSFGTGLWSYRTERVGWVLKSGRSRMLSNKFGYWPNDLRDFLEKMHLKHRWRAGPGLGR